MRLFRTDVDEIRGAFMGVLVTHGGREYEVASKMSASEVLGTIESAVQLVRRGLRDERREIFAGEGEEDHEIVEPWAYLPLADGNWLAIWVGSRHIDISVRLTPDDVDDWGDKRPSHPGIG